MHDVRFETRTGEPVFNFNFLWVLAGCVSLAMGVIGIILPLLPTTPLVILAAFCFGKGSPKLQNWLLAHDTFGPMIVNWRQYGAISIRAKCMAVCAMAAALALSFALGLSSLILFIQAACLLGAATFVLTRPSV